MSCIQLAQAALTLSSNTLEMLGEHSPLPSLPEKGLWNRWPLASCLITGVITTITSVASAVLGNLGLALAQGAASIALGALSIHLFCTMDLGDLEGYVTLFTQRINTLSSTALNLAQTNRSLHQTQQDLSEQLKNREMEFTQAQEQAEKAITKLGDITTQLTRSESDLQNMKKILTGSHQMMDGITTTMQNFIHINNGVTATSQQLALQLHELQAMEKQFSTSVQQLDRENSELSVYREQATKIAHDIYTQFMQMADLLISFKKQDESMRAGLQTLRAVDNDLSSHTGSLRQAVGRMDHQVEQTEGILNTMKRYTSVIDSLSAKLSDPSTSKTVGEACPRK